MDDKVLERLKETCGGSCITDPDNCHCFGMPSHEVLKDLDETEDTYEVINSAEECLFLDTVEWEVGKITKYEEQLNIDMAEMIYESAIGSSVLKDGYNKESLLKMLKDQLNSGLDPHNIGFMFLLNSFAIVERDEIPKRKEYVYILHSKHGYKIGRSHEPRVRSRTIGTKTPFEITKTEIYEVKNMSEAETGLHKYFKEYRLNGEWFNLTKDQLIEARDIIDKQYAEIKDIMKPLFEKKELLNGEM